ncbi:MAG: TonB-dependent receptor, partial [Thermoanaerobaculia bacterium]
MIRRALLLALLSLVTLPLFAQTSGGIVGKVTDTSGAAVPGVTVEAKSRALQGTRSAVSDTDGIYRFALLPPGEYTLVFNLSGFGPATHTGVVALGKDATFDVTLRLASVSETMTVSAEAPVLDTASASLGTNLSQRAIETLPTGRNYSSIAQVAPGVSTDANPSNGSQSTIAVYGSSGAENAYYIDGVNTTNMEYGFQGKELNFEFISEVDVKTGGYEAEFGRSTGGIINVITKSGGNQFNGDVFGYHDSDSLQSNADTVVSTGGTQVGFTRSDYGADLGGFIMRDKLWFFGAYDGVKNSLDTRLPGDTIGSLPVSTSKSRRNLGSGKLTFNLGASQSLVGTFLQDPRVDTGAINDANHTLNGDPSTYLGRQDFGGRDYALRYDGSFSSKWILSGQLARHREANSVGPSTSEGNGVQVRDAGANFFQTGGFGLIQNKSFDRKHYASSVMRILGGHEIKGGLEYEQATAEVTKRMSGGQQVDVFANEANPAKKIYSHFYWTTPDATVANAPLSQLVSSPEHRVTTAYVQDRWSVNDRLVATFGVRWDRQE